MTKSPAFQFYPDDFLGSGKVGTMTLTEIGAYFLLLCLDWNETGFVFDEEELARWCKTSRPAFRKAWRRISRCFVERDGRMFNPRLELERVKQAEWREKSAKGGRASAEARRKGGSTTLEPPYQPNVNTPSPSPTPVTTKATTRDAAQAGDAEFDLAWDVFPKRAGGNPKAAALTAWRARVAEGVSPAELLAAVRQYRAYAEATGKVGQEFVMQTATFFGTKKRGWEQDWTPPVSELKGDLYSRYLALVKADAVQDEEDAKWLAKRHQQAAS